MIRTLISRTVAPCIVKREMSGQKLAVSRIRRPVERITCTLIPGDGVGHELMASVQEILEAAGAPIMFERYFLSEISPHVSPPLKSVVESIKRNKICLKGPLKNPDVSAEGLQTVNMKLRRALDAYVNVVPIRTIPGVPIRYKNKVDIVIIREQVEGEYSSIEYVSRPGMVECLKIITRSESERVAKFAFDYATKFKRKKITAVHKANIQKLSDGLFLEQCRTISRYYPKIKLDTLIVDNCTMQIVAKPESFDVLVMPNLYGNIIDNLAAGLVGGAGVVPGASYSNDIVMFEPGAKHTFSSAVGKNTANPTAMIQCAISLLRHMNLKPYGDLIENSLFAVLSEQRYMTQDMGGQSPTSHFVSAIVHKIQARGAKP